MTAENKLDPRVVVRNAQGDLSFHSSNVRKDPKAKTESYFCNTQTVACGKETIDQIHALFEKNGGSALRISLHTGPEEGFHQMIIAHRKGHFYRPHKHLKKGEAYHMISGSFLVVLFNDSGTPIDVSTVSAPGAGRAEDPFIYRMGPNQWHCTIPMTDIVIFHEMKPGPFDPAGDSIYPAWAPDGSDGTKAKNFIEDLLKQTERRAK